MDILLKEKLFFEATPENNPDFFESIKNANWGEPVLLAAFTNSCYFGSIIVPSSQPLPLYLKEEEY
jgi:hypothetical protein